MYVRNRNELVVRIVSVSDFLPVVAKNFIFLLKELEFLPPSLLSPGFTCPTDGKRKFRAIRWTHLATEVLREF